MALPILTVSHDESLWRSVSNLVLENLEWVMGREGVGGGARWSEMGFL
jgi:hypothetical protein